MYIINESGLYALIFGSKLESAKRFKRWVTYKQQKEELHISDRNNTRIKYLKLQDKLYKVFHISFYFMNIEADETDLTTDDVPAEEVFDVQEFKEFRVALMNKTGNKVAEIIDFGSRKKIS